MDMQVRRIRRQRVWATFAISMMVAGCGLPATMGNDENGAGAGGVPVGIRESEGGKATSEIGARSENTAFALPAPTNALACSTDADCGSGFCVDDVCCDSACTGTCEACTAAKKGSGVDGECGFIKFDSNPDNECAIGSACDGKGACKFYNGVPCPVGDECLSYCVDGFCCGNVCMGTCESCSAAIKGGGDNGVCGPIAAGTDPQNECSGGSCDGAGMCSLLTPIGSACSSNAECGPGGSCVDGVCCDSACTGTCQACTAAKKGSGVDGVCGPIKFDSNPDNECAIGSACDGNGTCKSYNGVPCTSANDCLSYCVDGFCCGNVCTGTCESCSAAEKGGGDDGVCGPIAAGTVCPGGTCDGAGVCSGSGVCAGPSNIWYFGSGAGLDFSGGAPVGISSPVSSWEPCAVLSCGNKVRISTDGATVFDSTNMPMANGSDLLGESSATQGALLVPRPNSNEIFVFNVEELEGPGGAGPLHYSVVDMTQNGGLGDVDPAQKNLDLNPAIAVTEKMTSVQHANGVDTWVLVHAYGTDEFMAYLINAQGINGPVTSAVGSVANYSDSAGQLKASPNGTRLASGTTIGAELFDFNRATGQVSNPIIVPISFIGVTCQGLYGLEFSPNGNVLYGSCYWPNGLYQYDLSSQDATTIAASGVYLGAGGGANGGQIQRGPDGKLYIAGWLAPALSVVDQPNVLGVGAGFSADILPTPGTIYHGLPNILAGSY